MHIARHFPQLPFHSPEYGEILQTLFLAADPKVLPILMEWATLNQKNNHYIMMNRRLRACSSVLQEFLCVCLLIKPFIFFFYCVVVV